MTSSSTVIRMNNSKKAYISDSTFFIGVEDWGSDIDITTATGMMTVEVGTAAPNVYVIADDDDAVFVIYAAKELNGAANKDDIVYLDDDCDNRLSSSTYEGTLWFMKGLSDRMSPSMMTARPSRASTSSPSTATASISWTTPMALAWAS
ncbi:MAG: hypothetical protein V8R40_14895 [Dysosmobacter sp.]